MATNAIYHTDSNELSCLKRPWSVNVENSCKCHKQTATKAAVEGTPLTLPANIIISQRHYQNHHHHYHHHNEIYWRHIV